MSKITKYNRVPLGFDPSVARLLGHDPTPRPTCLRMVALFLYRFIAYIIFIASLQFYLLCHFLKSEADIGEVTVMEERRSQLDVFVLVQSLLLTDFLFLARNIEINNG